MPDVIDIVLDKLSASSLEYLDEINLNGNRESRDYSKELEKCVDTLESVFLNRSSRELNNKTELLISKTKANKILFDKYRSQFKDVQTAEIKTSNLNDKNLYDQKLNHLQERLDEFTKELEGDLEPEEIFMKLHDMQEKIEELEIKIREIKEKLDCYENFPANITEAQHAVADLKKRIKEKEAIVESNL